MRREVDVRREYADILGENPDPDLVRIVGALDAANSSRRAPAHVVAAVSALARKQPAHAFAAKADEHPPLQAAPQTLGDGRSGMFGLSRRLTLGGGLLAAVASVVLLIMASLYLLGRDDSGGVQEPIIIESDALMIASTAEERVAGADAIILGTVGEAYDSRWTTPSGKASDVYAASANGHIIYTDYPVKVDRVLHGSDVGETVRVRLTGGQVGEVGMMSSAEAELEPGQRVLLLLRHDDNPQTRDIGPKHYGINFASNGVYKVEGDTATSPSHTIRLTELPAFITKAEKQAAAAGPAGTPVPGKPVAGTAVVVGTVVAREPVVAGTAAVGPVGTRTFVLEPARQFGIVVGRRLKVVDLERGGVGEKSGVRIGDVLTEIDGTPLDPTLSFPGLRTVFHRATRRAVGRGAPAVLTVTRGVALIRIDIMPEIPRFRPEQPTPTAVPRDQLYI